MLLEALFVGLLSCPGAKTLVFATPREDYALGLERYTTARAPFSRGGAAFWPWQHCTTARAYGRSSLVAPAPPRSGL